MNAIPQAKVVQLHLPAALSARAESARPLLGVDPARHRGSLLRMLVNAASPVTCGGRPVRNAGSAATVKNFIRPARQGVHR